MKVQVTGIEAVLKRLNALKAEIEQKRKLFCERLAGIGVETAEIGFQSVAYDGTNDVEVGAAEWEDENTLVIRASGTSVLFIEFGAGVYNDAYPVEPPAEISPRGTYGKGYGKRRAWGYYDENGQTVITHGNNPARAMFDAGQRMREEIARIAKEVFAK